MKYRYHLGGRSYESAQTRVAAVLLAPTLLALVALYLIPIARVLVLSFTSTNTITNVSTFVGLKNFRYLFGNEVFLKTLGNTFVFTFFKLFAEVAVSLTLAVLLDTRVPMRKFLRISYFAPVVVPVVASSTIWLWFYDPNLGPLNQMLGWMGLPGSKWIYSADTALMSIIIFSVWRGVGYDVVVFLSGLQGIPDSCMEAARVDGASEWQTFWRIKLPLMKPMVAFVLMMGFIGSFQSFTEVDVMTPGGGPNQSTLLVVNYIYEQAFGNAKMGRGAAASVVLFVIVFAVTYLQRIISERTENDYA